MAQGLKKDVGGRFRYAVGLQSWVNLYQSNSTENIVFFSKKLKTKAKTRANRKKQIRKPKSSKNPNKNKKQKTQIENNQGFDLFVCFSGDSSCPVVFFVILLAGP